MSISFRPVLKKKYAMLVKIRIFDKISFSKLEKAILMRLPFSRNHRVEMVLFSFDRVNSTILVVCYVIYYSLIYLNFQRFNSLYSKFCSNRWLSPRYRIRKFYFLRMIRNRLRPFLLNFRTSSKLTKTGPKELNTAQSQEITVRHKDLKFVTCPIYYATGMSLILFNIF